MKPCHKSDDAVVYVRRAATVHNPFLMVTLQLNISTGTFLLVINAPAHFKIYCALCTVKAKNANKTI